MRAVPFIAIALLLGVADGRAEGRWLGDDEPAFGFVAGVASGTRLGDTLSVVVAAGGRYYTTTRATCALHIPPGIQLLSGDTLFAGTAESVAGNRTLRLLVTHLGHFEIRGQLAIDAGTNGTDVAEWVLPLDVRADTIIAEHSKYTRLELHKDGVRYRYAGRWLLQLESDEPAVVESELESAGSKARAVVMEPAKRPSGSATAKPDTLKFLVVLDAHGRLRESHLVGGTIGRADLGNEWLTSGRAALARWQFQPAGAPGPGVSDWILVSVPVANAK